MCSTYYRFKERALVPAKHQTIAISVGGGSKESMPPAYLSVWCWPAIPAEKVSLEDNGAGGTHLPQVCEMSPWVPTVHTGPRL